MKQLLRDVDTLLSTQSSFLLGKWIEDARSLGIDEASKNYYEENARTIVSTWGDKDQSLNDYAIVLGEVWYRDIMRLVGKCL